MNIKEFKDIIEVHNIPDDVEIIMDDGGECELNSAFPIDGVFYNQNSNEIVFVIDKLLARDYLGNEDWVCLNVAENEKEQFFIENFIAKLGRFNEYKLENYKEYLEFIDRNKIIVNPQKLGLKLLVFTDPKETFELYEEQICQLIKENVDFDLCVLIGETSVFELEWLLRLIPRDKIVAVKGNTSYYNNEYEQKNINVISYSIYHFNGVKLHGMCGFSSTKEESLCHMQHTSLSFVHIAPFKNSDVLISYDKALLMDEKDSEHPGMIGITDYIYSNKVQYHIHKGYENYERQYDNGTKDISVDKFACVEI